MAANVPKVAWFVAAVFLALMFLPRAAVAMGLVAVLVSMLILNAQMLPA